MKAKPTFEQEKCAACGICIEECPGHAIAISKRTKHAVLAYEKECISCGHCAAICPRNAITLGTSEKADFITVQKIDPSIEPEQRIFHEKRSVRNFTNQKLEQSTIVKLLSYAEKAPSSHNMRNRNYIIVQDEKRIQEMTEVILKAYKKVLHSLNPLVMGMIRILDKSGYEELSGMKLSFQRLLKE